MSRTVLVDFIHGLGDAVQFTVVLKHIRAHRPDWTVDVLAGRGKHTAMRGLCRAVYYPGQERPPDNAYDQILGPGWWENYNGYTDRPGSKVTNFLAEDVRIDYDPALGRYEVTPLPDELSEIALWCAGRGIDAHQNGKLKAVVLHYQGNTSPERKNLTDDIARAVVAEARAAGLKTILFDWDGRSPLPDEDPEWVVCPRPGEGDPWGDFGSGDAARIAAFITMSKAFVGIDSGPGKVASATETPTTIVWTRHHPIQFHDPAPNTLHLVPRGHEKMSPANGDEAKLAYFRAAYRFAEYDPRQLALAVRNQLRECLAESPLAQLGTGGAPGTLVPYGPFLVRADNHAQDLVVIQDVYANDSYRTRFYDLTQWDTVVDIGAHIGAFARKVHDANPYARIVCVEACPENIEALRRNVGDFATVIHAACTYESGEVALLNSVRPDCESTGGSVVVPKAGMDDPDHPLRQGGYKYTPDTRPLRKVTLEEVMAEAGIDHIDCLKLDCEGSEFSILPGTTSMPGIRFIFGEYHGQAKWDELRGRLFAGWDYGIMYQNNDLGVFHLVNPGYDKPRKAAPALRHAAQNSEPPAPTFENVFAALADAVVIDGGRSYHERATALARAVAVENRVIVSAGYDVDDRASGATAAVDWFVVSRPEFALRAVDAGLSPTATKQVAALWRPGRAGQAAKVPAPGRVLRIAVAPGIGDAAWAMTKIPALCKRLGARGVELYATRYDRALDYLGSLPLTLAVGVTPHELVDDPPHTAHGAWNYAPSQPGWHGEFDFLLQANGHLEAGGRIEKWLPGLDTDFGYPVPKPFALAGRDAETLGKLRDSGEYVTVYTSRLAANTTEGHNHGPLWRPRDWKLVAEKVARAGLRIVLVGAAHDQDYLEKFFGAGHFGAPPAAVTNLVGKTGFPLVMEVLRHARGHVGYQSGLGVLSCYAGVPTCMFWRPYGDHIVPGVTFREEMATAWVPPEVLEGGKYLGAVYGRTRPDQVAEFIIDG